jgi:hypothetical protein
LGVSLRTGGLFVERRQSGDEDGIDDGVIVIRILEKKALHGGAGWVTEIREVDADGYVDSLDQLAFATL